MTTTYASDACKDCAHRGESDKCAICPNYKPLCATCDYGEESDNYEHFFECHNKATETVGKWRPVECDHYTAAKQRENGKSPAECRRCDNKRMDGIRYYCATTTACNHRYGPKYIPCLDCEKFTAATRECAHGNSTARTVGCIGFQAKLVTVPPDSPSCKCAGDEPDDKTKMHYSSKVCMDCDSRTDGDENGDETCKQGKCHHYLTLCRYCVHGRPCNDEFYFGCASASVSHTGVGFVNVCEHYEDNGAGPAHIHTAYQPSRATPAIKPAWHLIPHGPLAAVAMVQALGAKKHGDHGWLDHGEADDYFRAVLQHLFAWRSGETYDEDSGQHPLAHAAARLLMLADIEEVK